jgi:gliding motility-associated-like protein
MRLKAVVLIGAALAALLAVPAAGVGAPDTTPPRITDVSDGPDPFTPNGDHNNDRTTIHWTIDERALVTVRVFKPHGKMVRDLMREHLARGGWTVQWSGRDDLRRMLPAGTYNYRIRAEDNQGNHRSVKGSVTIKR